MTELLPVNKEAMRQIAEIMVRAKLRSLRRQREAAQKRLDELQSCGEETGVRSPGNQGV